MKLFEELRCKSVKMSVARPDVAGYDCAILFVSALWSNYSKQRSRELITAIDALDDSCVNRLTVVIVNIDELDLRYMDKLFGTRKSIAGNGELLWIKDGKIEVAANCRTQLSIEEIKKNCERICS